MPAEGVVSSAALAGGLDSGASCVVPASPPSFDAGNSIAGGALGSEDIFVGFSASSAAFVSTPWPNVVCERYG